MNRKRQVVFIMTDTQGTDLVGCYGNPWISTPNIDRLAANGMRFNRAYTTQPVCGPARSGIFTGTYPHTNGSWTNSLPLGANVKTIGQRLKNNGIHTAYIGKWHLDGGDYFGEGDCPDGWDKEYWYDMRCYLEEMDEHDRRWSRMPEIMEKRTVTEDFTFGHKCTDRAVDFVSKHNDEDFFIVVSYDEPHDPFVCPEPYSSMYKNFEYPKKKNVWDNLSDKPEHHRVWAGKNLDTDKDALKIKPSYYLGCNSYIDYEIGRVLDAVEKHVPDALVIYTSDHGDMLNSHCLNGKGPVMYEEITRIPYIVSWKGKVKEGTVCEHPVSHIDLAPTILESMGLAVPKVFEGKSIIPALMDHEVKVNEAVFIEFTRYEVDHDGFGGYQPVRAAFDGRYKFVVNLMTSDELYDLENDPEEMKNLINSQEHEGVRNRLHDILLDWMNRTRDPFRGYYWERRPWRADACPATWGYTGLTRQRETEPGEKKQLDYSTGVEMESSVRVKDRKISIITKTGIISCFLILFILMQALLLSACASSGQPVNTAKPEATARLDPTIKPGNPTSTQKPRINLINEAGTTVAERIRVPDGYVRVDAAAGSYAEYLRKLPVKPHGAKVKYYNGGTKPSDVYEAVLDIDVGDRDLQQCADAVMRLWGEYLYGKGLFEKIHFNFTNGFKADYPTWMAGNRIKVEGNKVSWVKQTGYSNEYSSFRKYMDMVFAYAGTLSLSQEMLKVSLQDMRIGDVFLKGPDPGHCVLVIDMAENKAIGEKIFMVAQSYMPAQDIHILKNNANGDGNPWYSINFGEKLSTPEWTFNKDQLVRFAD